MESDSKNNEQLLNDEKQKKRLMKIMNNELKIDNNEK